MWVLHGNSRATSQEQHGYWYQCSNCVIGYHIASHSNLAVYSWCKRKFRFCPEKMEPKHCTKFVGRFNTSLRLTTASELYLIRKSVETVQGSALIKVPENIAQIAPFSVSSTVLYL